MAHICRDEDFFGVLARDHQFAVREVAGLKGRVDHRVVLALGQVLALLSGQAEAPGAVVVTRDVGNGRAVLGVGMQVGLQLRERQRDVDGHRVAHQMHVAVGEVHDALSAWALEVGGADVPLVGHGPVEHRGAGRHLVDPQPGQDLTDDPQGVAHAVPGDAAVDGKQAFGQRVEELPFSGGRRCFEGGRRHIRTITNVPAERSQAEVLLVVATLGRRPEYLDQTLASIRSQDVTADIVIVGPLDAPGLAATAERVGARLLPDPGGLPEAINLGVDEGLRDHAYVNWLNDDDLLEPGSLRTTTAALEATPDAVVAFGACRYIDEAGRELWISRAGRWAPWILRWGPDLIPQPGMLVRASAWREIGGVDPSYRLAFDLDLLLKLQKIGRLVDTGAIVSSFRWHANSLTVDDRGTNIAESERAKRAALSPTARRLAWLWEAPVRVATRVAAREVNRRAARAA